MPAPTSDFYIADFANVLEANSPEHGDNLLRWITNIHEYGFAEYLPGAQLVLVTVPSLSGLSAEHYAESLLDTWDVGASPSGYRGMILLIAPNDNC